MDSPTGDGYPRPRFITVFAWCFLANEVVWAISHRGTGAVVVRYVPIIAGLGMTAILVNHIVWKNTQRWLAVFSWLALVLSLAEYAP